MRDTLKINGEVVEVIAGLSPDATAKVTIAGTAHTVTGVRREGGVLEFTLDGKVYRFAVHSTPNTVAVTDGQSYHTFARVIEGAVEEEEGAVELSSQMPGTVLKIMVAPGTEVAKGSPLLILEAMKMEHEVCAPSDGTVTGYPHSEGDRVMPGDLLVEFEIIE